MQAQLNLRRPPINEVIFNFTLGDTGLDAADVAVYADTIKEQFPRRETHPAFVNSPITLGFGSAVRWVLTSSDDVYVLQLQADRFILNWRSDRGMAYPGMASHRGPDALIPVAIRHLEHFGEFVRQRGGAELTIGGLVLSKIDFLKRGTFWQDDADVMRLAPAVFKSPGEMFGAPGQAQANYSWDIAEPFPRTLVASVQFQPAFLRVQSDCAVSSGPPETPLEDVLHVVNADINNLFQRTFAFDGTADTTFERLTS